MKSKSNSSKKIIIVLSCLVLLVAFGICIITVYMIGSISADSLYSDNESRVAASHTPLPDFNGGQDVFPTYKPTKEPAFPDVSISYATPEPEFFLSQTKEESSASFESPADIVDAVKDGVVGITNYHYDRNKDSYFAYGNSSGFIVSESGYILTNAHAVSDAKKLEVTFSDSSVAEALMVGFDLTTDIAVIKIPEEKVLCYLTLGDSSVVRSGEYVLAIGNPLGSEDLYGTVSMGIISGTNRQVNIDGFTNTFIQTDAALNPGNSGGPLLNMQGHVIGMNTAKSITAGYDSYGQSISSEGIGFSLPINDVILIANTLIQNGFIPRPGIGITVYTLNAEDAESVNLVEGVFIDSVNEGSPAESAGLLAGDVIVKCNGETLTDKDRLVELVKSTPMGEKLSVTVYRSGEYLDFEISIGNMNDFNR